MHVEGDVHIPASKMSPEEYGVFFHEYVHYLQHLTSAFGINRCMFFQQLFANVLEYVRTADSLSLPIDFAEHNEVVKKIMDQQDGYLARVQGSKRILKVLRLILFLYLKMK